MATAQSNMNDQAISNTSIPEANNKRHVGGGDAASLKLLQAAINGDIDDLRKLITNRPGINSWIEKTALPLAARYRFGQFMRVLIDHGGDIHVRSNDGWTMLHSAALVGNTDYVQLLVNKGCAIHAQTNSGWTVLHSAAWGGSIECVQLLYGLGVDISAKTEEGKTAYITAREWGKTKTAELIKRLSNSPATTTVPNANMEQIVPTSHSTSMEIDEPSPNPKPKQQNRCMRCQCKTCTSKENQINNLQQENTEVKEKIDELENKGKVIEAQMHATETHSQSIEKLQEGYENILQENEELKVQMTEMLKRMKSFELLERGHCGIPRVVTPMDGFDYGNMIGKDYMNSNLAHIFCNATFQTFRARVVPYLVADELWTNHIITERQYQEINGLSSDIAKGEYLWGLMKQGRRYLEAVRTALRTTEQKR